MIFFLYHCIKKQRKKQRKNKAKMPKLIKIKNLPNSQDILIGLIELLLASEPSHSPLVEKINHPNGDFYVIIDRGIIIPGYIEVKGDEALVLWIHPDYRNKGYAKFMINTLGIKYAVAAPSSIPFWEKLGFRRVNKFSSGPTEMRLY